MTREEEQELRDDEERRRFKVLANALQDVLDQNCAIILQNNIMIGALNALLGYKLMANSEVKDSMGTIKKLFDGINERNKKRQEMAKSDLEKFQKILEGGQHDFVGNIQR